MATKVVASAAAGDVAICLALEPPTAGVNVGGPPHVVIPADFAAKIASGKDVPGCTYAKIEFDGSLYVTDAVQTKLVDSKTVTALSPTLQTDATALQTKLATAVVIQGSAVLAKG